MEPRRQWLSATLRRAPACCNLFRCHPSPPPPRCTPRSLACQRAWHVACTACPTSVACGLQGPPDHAGLLWQWAVGSGQPGGWGGGGGRTGKRACAGVGHWPVQGTASPAGRRGANHAAAALRVRVGPCGGTGAGLGKREGGRGWFWVCDARGAHAAPMRSAGSPAAAALRRIRPTAASPTCKGPSPVAPPEGGCVDAHVLCMWVVLAVVKERPVRA